MDFSFLGNAAGIVAATVAIVEVLKAKLLPKNAAGLTFLEGKEEIAAMVVTMALVVTSKLAGFGFESESMPQAIMESVLMGLVSNVTHDKVFDPLIALFKPKA